MYVFTLIYKGTAKVRATRQSEAHSDGSEQEVAKEDFGKNLKDLPKALWLLLKNPVNMFINAAGVFESLSTSGIATFAPKLIENQFGQTAATAAMISGKTISVSPPFYALINFWRLRVKGQRHMGST